MSKVRNMEKNKICIVIDYGGVEHVLSTNTDIEIEVIYANSEEKEGKILSRLNDKNYTALEC